MRGYHPRGVTFDTLVKNVRKGVKFYVLAYYPELVTRSNTAHPKTVEYLDRIKAVKAYKKLLEEDSANGTMKAYYLKEFEFKGDTWNEHVRNGLHDAGVHVDIDASDPDQFGDFRIEPVSKRKFVIINTAISKRVMTETSMKRAREWIGTALAQPSQEEEPK